MFRRSCFVFILLFWVPLALTSCVRKVAKLDSGRITVDSNSEPVTLDPSRVEDGLGIRLVANIMDGLMGFNSQGVLVQRLAESIEVSKDLKTYRFTLKKGAQWSDGVPVDVDQFKVAIERALQPKTGSKLSGFLKWIEGATAYSEGRAKAVTGIKTDGRDIIFQLIKPVSFFDQVLALPIAYPLRRDVLEANDGKWDPLRGKNVPTNGAYRIRSSTPDQEILLEASRALPKMAPKEVRVRIVNDESTGATLFEKGELDVLSRIPAIDLKRFIEKGVVKSVPLAVTYFLGLNPKKKPFDQIEYRRAFAGAMKRTELMRVLDTGERAGNSWIPAGSEGALLMHENSDGRDPKFQADVAKIKALTTSPEVTIAFDASERNNLILEKVQADLKEALGWKVRLRNLDWKPHVRAIYSDPEQVFRFGWSSPMQDPTPFLLPFVTRDPFSFSGYANPKYDRLVEEIVGMRPSEKRAEKMKEAQEILISEAVLIVPLFHYMASYAVGPRVAKFPVSPIVGVTLFEEVEMK